MVSALENLLNFGTIWVRSRPQEGDIYLPLPALLGIFKRSEAVLEQARLGVSVCNNFLFLR